MIAGSLARRYARALFEVGTGKGTEEQLCREVEDLAASYDSSRELSEALSNPIFPQSRRRAVLAALLERAGASPHARNFALLLVERDRMPFLPSIARELRLMVDEKAGRVRAEITSAKPLTGEQTARIVTLLERATGKQVVAQTSAEPELLGGVVTRLGDTVYDGSVRTQLAQMRERFLA